MVAEMNRRDFLKLSALAAAGVTVAACAKTEAPAEPTATTPPEEKPTATPVPEAGPSEKQAPILAARQGIADERAGRPVGMSFIAAVAGLAMDAGVSSIA